MSHEKSPIWTKSFITIFISNFFIFLIFYGLLTTLPIYVVEDLQRTDKEGGLIVTAFLLSAIVVRPFSGRLLETYGKKKMLMFSLTLFLLSTFLYMLVKPYFLLLALRFFQGIWFSIATTATGAIAADLVPVKRRGEGLGYFVMSNNFAVVCGPFIALFLLQSMSFDWLFLVLGILMTIGAVFTLSIKVNETPSPLSKRKISLDDLFETKAIPIALIGCLIAFSYSSVLSFISIYAKSLGLIEAASFFFVIFAVVMLVSRPFSGRLFDTRGPNFVMYPAFISFALGLFTLSIVESSISLLLAGAFIGLGYGTLVPSFQTIAVQSADHKRSAHATATFFTFFDSGIAAGSFVLGIIASLYGYSYLYLFASILVLLVLVIYRWKQAGRKAQAYQINENQNI
ncbi:MFS transporter [Metabacillus arenae]|uniref:MFS transporter n=1 Tax=Metabacillus arenae TaxID=2771434 RepID=A0A926NCE4_9BACI|nr:MFS transporter [Metabacillus arenae]MBD1378969.1 MFS transporter [Metabacillus arenae]